MTTELHFNSSAPRRNPLAGQRIRHPRIADTIEECQLMLAPGSSADLILTCGPTGVGKTTLGNVLLETELKDQAAVMTDNPGYIPCIRVSAPSSGEKEFSWRLFYHRILNELDGEFDVPRAAYGVDPSTGRVSRSKCPTGNGLHVLRTAVERSLENRETRFIVVDEAAHMLKQCSPKDLEKQLNTLKSLSNDGRVQWVLQGSYDLFELVSLSGQLARRSHVIHFGRYREDLAEDVRAFRGCLKQLAQSMPALKDVDVLRYSEVLHRNTLGCIGMLRDVLVRLALLVVQRGWSEKTLRTALFTEAQVTRILQEIVEGEARIAPGLTRDLLGGGAA